MSEIKKYTDIVRLGHKSTVDVLHAGDHITITEKIDGANSSFILNENGDIDCFSRNTNLDAENTLRGFYGWAQSINADNLNPNFRYYGEWLVSHKIQYKPEYYNKFYLFNVYDEEAGLYLSDKIMRAEASRLNLNTVPLIYEGEYISFDHLMSFVGKSDMAISYGEGIVVKNVDYRDRYGHQLFVKLVHEDFCEIQKQKKPKNPNVPETPEQAFVSECLTEARVDKMLHKLVDENLIPEQYGIEDMRIILSAINTRLYDDIIKEESDSLPEGYDEKLIKAAVGKKVSQIVKGILNRSCVA